ncbi:MAG TPA: hypothetical protein VKX33_00030 [Cyclobacteriaceae bacterium]|nr:hypothetical protein [Cyclobacteriaceae bacterium]
MEKFLKYLKTEAIGGLMIRYSLAGLLLFGGFAKLTLIGGIEDPIIWAIFIAAIETLAALGLLLHSKNPLYGILGGFLAVFCVLIRLVYSLFWIKAEIIGVNSVWEAFQVVLSLFNNGLFFVILLFGAAIFCIGNSYKAYIHRRITQPWPR